MNAPKNVKLRFGSWWLAWKKRSWKESVPRAKPHPSIVVREELADGTEVEVIWAWLPESYRAMLVTVYFPE